MKECKPNNSDVWSLQGLNLTAYSASYGSVAAGKQTKACGQTRADAWVQISNLNMGAARENHGSGTRFGGAGGGV